MQVWTSSFKTYHLYSIHVLLLKPIAVKSKIELPKRIQRARNLHFDIWESFGEKHANFLALSVLFGIFNDLRLYSMYLASAVSNLFRTSGENRKRHCNSFLQDCFVQILYFKMFISDIFW